MISNFGGLIMSAIGANVQRPMLERGSLESCLENCSGLRVLHTVCTGVQPFTAWLGNPTRLHSRKCMNVLTSRDVTTSRKNSAPELLS